MWVRILTNVVTHGFAWRWPVTTQVQCFRSFNWHCLMYFQSEQRPLRRTTADRFVALHQKCRTIDIDGIPFQNPALKFRLVAPLMNLPLIMLFVASAQINIIPALVAINPRKILCSLIGSDINYICKIVHTKNELSCVSSFWQNRLRIEKVNKPCT